MIPFQKKPWAKADDWTWDIEATNLLNEETIDYQASPYKLLPSYSTHCVVFQNHVSGEIVAFHDGEKYEFDGREHSETIEGCVYTLAEGYEPVEYTHRPMSELKGFIQNTTFNRLVAHNQISYDLLAMKAVYGFDYSIGDEIKDGGLTTWTKDKWAGKPLSIFDTLVVSKCLNPDRYGGHSLDKLAAGGTSEKFKFRKEVHVSERFKHFAADMLYYCIFDVKANTEVYNMLIETYGLDSMHEFQKWASALKLEHAVAELITRQEHRGFWFDMKKAEAALTKLDAMMEERRVKVEPLLPPRPATKKFMGDYTPPKNQFKKNGELSSHMEKFVAKYEGVVDGRKLTMFGKEYDLPLAEGVPLKTTMPAEIGNTTHIKNWLVSLGWHPNEYKEKDLTVDDKKVKLDAEKLLIKINRYIDETFDSAFKNHRLEHLEGLGVTPKSSKDFVRRQMLKRAERQGLKVLSNPSFTVGADKEMCPDLERITEQFPFTKDIVEYLTFKHRRNSILGGGQDWEDPDEEPEKGYMAGVRPDGRIATPADTCGAATSRFKHRKVANVPRVTSLFGKELRELFGVATGYFQIGYDFDSLEARVESAYCYMYDADDKAYCKSLMLEKPFDVHTMMAKAISKIIGTDFGRSPAKNVKYGCTYGAQAAKVAKTIGSSIEVGNQVFEAFWDAAFPLKMLKDALQKQWEANGKKFIYGIDGRRVPTRSAHAILNSLFQSGGVICAKRAMVLHDRKLKAEGLSVDFFLDDWKSKTFCQQMIAYHDEAQLEASASLFKFKAYTYASIGFTAFDDKDALKEADKKLKAGCQEYKDFKLAESGEVWSDISHNDRGFYVAYCRAGVLATDAVREAGQFYAAPEGIDSPVAPVLLDLTAGYIVERSWAGCH
jgi:hypothetical protein